MPTTGQLRRRLGIGSRMVMRRMACEREEVSLMKEAIRDRLTDGDAKDGVRAGGSFVNEGGNQGLAHGW
jgi:hypothetical protein